MIYGFVMAAGASRRFGDIKQLAKIDGVSMALRSYNILNKILEERTYLVLGANAEFIARDFQEVNIIYNRHKLIQILRNGLFQKIVHHDL